MAVSDEDRAAGFDTAIAIATASGEVLIAAVTGGAADILAKGGQIARTAGGAVVVFDAAGNIIGVVRGAVDVVSSGLTIQNGMQIVGSGLGLAGNSVALRGKTFDIKERGATCPNTSQTCPIPPKELPRGNFPQTSTVVHPSNFLPRNAPEFGGFAHGITPEEIATINRNLGGTTILTGDVTTTLVNASRREGFWNKVATIVRDIAGGHKFNDANKRTAQAVVEELMRRNNICTGVTADEMKKIILRVATGELREVDEIASALRGF